MAYDSLLRRLFRKICERFSRLSMFHKSCCIDILADPFRNSGWPARPQIFWNRTPISNEMSARCLQVQFTWPKNRLFVEVLVGSFVAPNCTRWRLHVHVKCAPSTSASATWHKPRMDRFGSPGSIEVPPIRGGTPLPQSSRSRTRGLTESARCAGIQVASRPSAAIARTTPTSTTGSRGVA